MQSLAAVPSHARRIELTLILMGAALFAVLAYQVRLRVLFPWDLLIWSESPFMTNMLKLSHGLGIYSDPSDANSFVYSPGLEYLSFALLRPLALQLDVRWCRLVVVALGVLGCLCAARSGMRLLGCLSMSKRSQRSFLAFAALLGLLILGKNFTADVCHPDNLLIAHVCLSLLLGARALLTPSLGRALVAVAFASLGVLAKQTGAAGGLGMLAGLLIACPELRPWRRSLSLVVVAAAVTGLCVLPILMSDNARFWLLTVPGAHDLEVWKSQHLLRDDIIEVPHRLLLFAAAPYAFVWLRLRPEPWPRRFATVWLSLGVAGVLPILLAYFKYMGDWNNLGIIDLWAATLVLPVLWYQAGVLLDHPGQTLAGAALPLAVTSLLLLSVVPTRLPPTPAHWEYGRRFDAKVAEAVAQGRSVLVAHGTMPLLHAGLRDVPRDRANSALELQVAKRLDRAGTRKRIEQRAYDRIFVNGTSGWYGDLFATMKANYNVEETIPAAHALPGARGTEGLDTHWGYQQGALLMNTPMLIMAPGKPKPR